MAAHHSNLPTQSSGVPVAIVILKNRLPSPVKKLFVDCAREVTKAMKES